MEFHLFGQVEVRADGNPVEVGRRRERGLLALLLIDVGAVVPAERLIDLLCADDLPVAEARRQPHAVDRARLLTATLELRRGRCARTSPRSGYARTSTAGWPRASSARMSCGRRPSCHRGSAGQRDQGAVGR